VHILILTDRDWTHPQGGGTGTNLVGHVSRWLEWGHQVSVIACGYEGCERYEERGALRIHRVGGRSTVFPHAIWRQWRGLVPDADVMLEVVNGITFLTPVWCRTPRLTLVHHVHREHYVREMGRKGALAAFLLETAPLKWLYRGSRFLTISRAGAADLAELGIPREAIDITYLGVDADAFGPGERAPEPTLLYLGRLKRYKRIELLLDVLQGVPEAVMDVAGDGDYRPELEAEVARRGLGDRVRMHGHVSEERKVELLQRAWVNLTASSSEGWCLTVMEAAACGTPSAAMAVGGLPESIVDEETGLLADSTEGLVDATARLVRDPGLRERLGRNALERAREFTWDRTAERDLELLEREREPAEGESRPTLWRALAGSDTGRAAGMAAAVIASNVIALAFTVVFARLLGASDYGSLAVLLSAFIILMVPGSALQIAVAREVSRAVAGHEPHPGAGVRRWLGRLGIATLLVTAVAIPLRDVIAAVINVDEVWAAAAVPLTSMLWMLLAVERGALQGFGDYRAVGYSIVGEAGSRLVFGLVLVAVGLDVTGAFLGSAASLVAMGLVLAVPLHRRLPHTRRVAFTPPLRSLLAGAWVPVIGLTLLFALQEVHVIVVKHEASSDAAGSYAVAAVAAKAVIWVAIGLGLYLLPEAARRARTGVDARPVLASTLALIALFALPLLLIFAVGAEPLLRAVFGDDLTEASGALPWLGLAMTLLACGYLSVQYLLALGRAGFIWVLAPAALLEVGLLAGIGADLEQVALALFGLQLVCAVILVTLSFRTKAGPPQPEDSVVAEALGGDVSLREVPVEHAHAARASGPVRLGLRRQGTEPADYELGA
jgi:glycosyltransferase involved in cell wall biosynthesis/O-antigen/teichoic acid export membrane protein